MNLKDKLFSFRGRLRRLDWWAWGIALAIVHNVLAYVSGLAWGLDGGILIGGTAPILGDPWPALAHSVAFSLLFAWPQLALSAKRAHDRNWPAWPFIAIDVTGLIAAYLPFGPFAALGGYATEAPTAALTTLYVAFFVVWIGSTIALGFMDGTPGPNRFGPSPKAGERPALDEPGVAG